MGNRLRRTGWLWTGASISLVVLALLAALLWAVLAGTNLNPYKPLWMLRFEAGGSGSASNAALVEINRRLGSGSLSDSQIASTAEVALSVQGDRNTAWNSKWGDFIEQAHRTQKITAEQWRRYAKQAADFQIELRPRVRRGDPLAYRGREGPSRVGGRVPVLVARCRNGVISISGHEIRDDQVIGHRQLQPTQYGIQGSGSFDLTPILDELQDGPQTVTIATDAEVYESYDATEPLGSRRLNMSATFVLTPANEPTLKIIHDESLRQAVEKGLKIKRISVKGRNLYTQITFADIPVPLSYTVVMRAGDKERTIGGFTWHPSERIRGYGQYADLEPRPPPVVDVIFRPNREYPLRTIHIFEMWDGEVVCKNVPVDLPTSQPAKAPR